MLPGQNICVFSAKVLESEQLFKWVSYIRAAWTGIFKQEPQNQFRQKLGPLLLKVSRPIRCCFIFDKGYYENKLLTSNRK